MFETMAIVSTLCFAAIFVGLIQMERSARRRDQDEQK